MSVDRLIALVRRELGSEDVRVVAPDAEIPDNALSAALSNGHRVVVVLTGDGDREAKTRRLEILVESFGETFRSTSSPSRPPPALSLHAELQGLAQRAGAVDAVVIDAQSPVVWGAAEDEEAAPHLLARDNVISLDAHRPSGDRLSPQQPEPQRDPPASTRAVDAVRALESLSALHRGGHLNEKHVEEGLAYLARSFAGIYVILLVFDGAFDELRAERALALSLPTIERLVTALPPLDPTPLAGAVAIRRRRR